MNTFIEKITGADTKTAVSLSEAEVRASDRMAVFAAALFAGALTLAGWLILSPDTLNVFGAALEEPLPQVPYFPSQYMNQATEPSPVPANF